MLGDKSMNNHLGLNIIDTSEELDKWLKELQQNFYNENQGYSSVEGKH